MKKDKKVEKGGGDVSSFVSSDLHDPTPVQSASGYHSPS